MDWLQKKMSAFRFTSLGHRSVPLCIKLMENRKRPFVITEKKVCFDISCQTKKFDIRHKFFFFRLP